MPNKLKLRPVRQDPHQAGDNLPSPDRKAPLCSPLGASGKPMDPTSTSCDTTRAPPLFSSPQQAWTPPSMSDATMSSIHFCEKVVRLSKRKALSSRRSTSDLAKAASPTPTPVDDPSQARPAFARAATGCIKDPPTRHHRAMSIPALDAAMPSGSLNVFTANEVTEAQPASASLLGKGLVRLRKSQTSMASDSVKQPRPVHSPSSVPSEGRHSKFPLSNVDEEQPGSTRGASVFLPPSDDAETPLTPPSHRQRITSALTTLKERLRRPHTASKAEGSVPRWHFSSGSLSGADFELDGDAVEAIDASCLSTPPQLDAAGWRRGPPPHAPSPKRDAAELPESLLRSPFIFPDLSSASASRQPLWPSHPYGPARSRVHGSTSSSVSSTFASTFSRSPSSLSEGRVNLEEGGIEQRGLAPRRPDARKAGLVSKEHETTDRSDEVDQKSFVQDAAKSGILPREQEATSLPPSPSLVGTSSDSLGTIDKSSTSILLPSSQYSLQTPTIPTFASFQHASMLSRPFIHNADEEMASSIDSHCTTVDDVAAWMSRSRRTSPSTLRTTFHRPLKDEVWDVGAFGPRPQAARI